MRTLGQIVLWIGYAMLIACLILFGNYFLFGVKPNDGDVDFWRGPVLPFFLLMAGLLLAFTGFMVRGAFSNSKK
jgi:amino acid transporter